MNIEIQIIKSTLGIQKKNKKLFDQLKNFEEEKIFLPVNKDNYPDKEYLRLHMERKNKKIKQ